MLYLEQFAFDSPKLFIFYLGGNVKNGNIEMHDVVFVVAKTDEEASKKIKSKWFGTEKSLHVDSWFIAENIDGFEVKILQEKPQMADMHLYFVNLGFYKCDVFGESHFMTLVIANSKSQAIEKAKMKSSPDKEMLHSDNVYDLDDCIRIDEVDNYYIELEYNGVSDAIKPTNGYQKLRIGGCVIQLFSQ